jgi:two-component system, CAI-1 autoinducer sensor kinase/phosphatase CqsS
MGLLGAVGYTAFYFLRFLRPDPELFEDLPYRVLAVLLFAVMGLKEFWPEKLKPYYIRYSYFVLLSSCSIACRASRC